MRSALIGCLLASLAGAVALGCGDRAGEEAKQLGDNFEQSVEIEKKTYAEKRAEGEGRLEAAGDAYDAVLEEGRKKEDEKKEDK